MDLKDWYNIYIIQSYFCMMANMFYWMNILSFKKEDIDITLVGAKVDLMVSDIQRFVLRKDTV